MPTVHTSTCCILYQPFEMGKNNPKKIIIIKKKYQTNKKMNNNNTSNINRMKTIKMGKKFEMETNITEMSWYIFVTHLFFLFFSQLLRWGMSMVNTLNEKQHQINVY